MSIKIIVYDATPEEQITGKKLNQSLSLLASFLVKKALEKAAK